ncbi:thioredoxin-dependent thiol peroxidase [Spirulina subsalsa FACHB-351]|uniref:thioredoxin-dependent peroxiredoxin n=1 Tax=Spirulina subsalsa FACHB-351 TaxID=234711 RepID=A0ABT3LAB7_9CYAN|nr:thioredoxin-dependent thiol peroxidase [Spirulina subsalsa]MCW6038451.1 thioredoxin-dependent thiol peroxidase [Spirulina subsalsa FACHB-351]
MLKIGEIAPDFSQNNAEGTITELKDFRGKWLVLYFYPKDNTPGCTTEAQEFSALVDEFLKLNAVVVGVSPDSEKSHCRFRDKHNLSVILLSDPEHKMAENYGVWQLKKFMGKEYMGIVRSTFLINPEGQIAQIWTKVKAKGHAQVVLDSLAALV